MVALHQDDAFIRTRQPRRRTGIDAAHLRIVTPEPYPRVSKSYLPDGADYQDTGCELSPSCLACPFDRCKYDEPELTTHQLSTRQRDREIALLRREHRAPIMLLAATYGVSRRTVFRILKEQRHVA